eukprot:scaffold45385_cov22-Tisochrysis_lutea.AAC.5
MSFKCMSWSSGTLGNARQVSCIDATEWYGLAPAPAAHGRLCQAPSRHREHAAGARALGRAVSMRHLPQRACCRCAGLLKGDAPVAMCVYHSPNWCSRGYVAMATVSTQVEVLCVLQASNAFLGQFGFACVHKGQIFAWAVK